MLDEFQAGAIEPEDRQIVKELLDAVELELENLLASPGDYSNPALSVAITICRRKRVSEWMKARLRISVHPNEQGAFVIALARALQERKREVKRAHDEQPQN